MPTVAEQIADYLYAKGCTHAFGIVGGANLALFSAIAERLQVISMNHEQAAAMAANYFYRYRPCTWNLPGYGRRC